ncbi:MAG: hypothetical protein V4819_19325 [Verrucomicrobiota bacterium]
MGYVYTATFPGSRKSLLVQTALITSSGPIDALALDASERRFLVVDLYADPIERALRRRIDACRERRREAALSPGNDDDFASWKREVDRGEKLSRALRAHLIPRL